MSLKMKRIGIIIAIIITLIVLSVVIANSLIKRKIVNLIDTLPKHISVNYEDIDVNIATGFVMLESPTLAIKGQTTDVTILETKLNSLRLEGLSVLKLVFDDTISLERLCFEKPQVIYHHNSLIKDQEYQDRNSNTFKMPFNIDYVKVSDASIDIRDMEDDSSMLRAVDINLDLMTVISETKTSKLPFSFETISIDAKDITYQLGNFELLSASRLTANNEESILTKVKLLTTYSKQELSKHINVERDHFNLSIRSILFKRPKFIIEQDERLGFVSENLTIKTPHFVIYRDKLVNDDLVEKKLYSELLNSLNFDLSIDHTSITEGTIVYQEKTKVNRAPGELEFSNVMADIKNLGNMYASTNPTDISINALFMEDTPLSTNWSFDANNSDGNFMYKTEIGQLKAAQLNQFMKPNLNIKLEGELLKTYFTIDGNSNTSRVDLKTNYDNFDIVILKDNGEEKNKFLSGLVNFFIAQNSDGEADGYRYSDTKTVERDKTKSVFNFIWKNVQSGLMSAMTGDGKRDD